MNRSVPFLSPGVELEVLVLRKGRVIKSEYYDLKRAGSDRGMKLTLLDAEGKTFELVSSETCTGTSWTCRDTFPKNGGDVPYSDPKDRTVLVVPNVLDDVTNLVLKGAEVSSVRSRTRIPALIEDLLRKVESLVTPTSKP